MSGLEEIRPPSAPDQSTTHRFRLTLWSSTPREPAGNLSNVLTILRPIKCGGAAIGIARILVAPDLIPELATRSCNAPLLSCGPDGRRVGRGSADPVNAESEVLCSSNPYCGAL